MPEKTMRRVGMTRKTQSEKNSSTNQNNKKTMAKINFGGVEENVVTREEFPLKKALETLKD